MKYDTFRIGLALMSTIACSFFHSMGVIFVIGFLTQNFWVAITVSIIMTALFALEHFLIELLAMKNVKSNR